MVSLDLLKEIEIFKGFNYDQLVSVQKYCEKVQFKHEEKIFSEGDEAIYLYAVESGKVNLRFDLPGPGRKTSEENNISSVGEYKTFGWSSMVSPFKHTLSSYCATMTCKAIRIHKDKLKKIFKEDSMTGYLFMMNLSEIIGQRFHLIQEALAVSKGFDILHSW